MKIVKFLVVPLLLATSTFSIADQHMGGDLRVEQAWARASAGDVPNGAAYVTVQNFGHHEDRIVGAESPAAKSVELHTHTMDGGMMRMRRVDAVEVHPGEPAVFAPGGNHIMLMGLTKPLKEGDSFPLTLKFEKGGSVTVDVAVQGIASMAPDQGAHGMHQMHHDMKHEEMHEMKHGDHAMEHKHDDK